MMNWHWASLLTMNYQLNARMFIFPSLRSQTHTLCIYARLYIYFNGKMISDWNTTPRSAHYIRIKYNTFWKQLIIINIMLFHRIFRVFAAFCIFFSFIIIYQTFWYWFDRLYGNENRFHCKQELMRRTKFTQFMHSRRFTHSAHSSHIAHTCITSTLNNAFDRNAWNISVRCANISVLLHFGMTTTRARPFIWNLGRKYMKIHVAIRRDHWPCVEHLYSQKPRKKNSMHKYSLFSLRLLSIRGRLLY